VIMICLYIAKVSREGQVSYNPKPDSKMVIQVVICCEILEILYQLTLDWWGMWLISCAT
jgi:hypothetical protein